MFRIIKIISKSMDKTPNMEIADTLVVCYNKILKSYNQ